LIHDRGSRQSASHARRDPFPQILIASDGVRLRFCHAGDGAIAPPEFSRPAMPYASDRKNDSADSPNIGRYRLPVEVADLFCLACSREPTRCWRIHWSTHRMGTAIVTTIFAVIAFAVGFTLLWLVIMKPARDRWRAIQRRKANPDGDTSGATPGDSTPGSNLNT
ncbi:MAG: hypothetical protein JWN34_2398, partial [Bryobacterales bacterium]|nr:hypothetical protein [Bryobacterales bacterium]